MSPLDASPHSGPVSLVLEPGPRNGAHLSTSTETRGESGGPHQLVTWAPFSKMYAFFGGFKHISANLWRISCFFSNHLKIK